MEPSEIWDRVCDRVRQEIADPTVWIAAQAAKPLLIDGNFFVAALPPPEEYLATNLLNNQATIAIEDALRDAAGRILAFRLIVGTSASDWEAEKGRGQANEQTNEPALAPVASRPAPAFQPAPAANRPAANRPTSAAAPSVPASASIPAEAARDVSQSWEKLSERLNLGYKSAPFIKYPHGQAQYVLTAVKMISDTMDVQMPPPGAPRDDAQERLLAKVIERLSGIANLDPLFISLELLRYREMHGKNVDIAL